MLRGEQENMCLKKVKECISKGKVKHSLTFNELTSVQNILFNALPNLESSKFPDFVSGNAIIEHFKITSSKETSKGSKDQQERFRFHKECDNELKDLVEKTADVATPNEMRVLKKEMDCPEYNYENYVYSFKKNWEHHIKSLDKYDNNDKTVVFLVEYDGPIFAIMKPNQFVDFYDLHVDKEMLLYINQFKDKVDYVVFYDQTECEIIKLNDIMDIFKKIPEEIEFKSGKLKYFSISMLVDF